MMHGIITTLFAGIACAGFCLVYNVRGKRNLFFHTLGGMLGWAIYLLLSFLGSEPLRCFWAAVAISVYAEIMARVFRSPATVYLQVSVFPLVPGGGIYYTMLACINGDMQGFATKGLHTLGVAGALAMGILLVSSLFRMHTALQKIRKERGYGKI